jgi:O-antigen/teichoic acid export membrane protein
MTETLAKKSVTAFSWGAGGAIVRLGLQFMVQVVLARLLGPGDYGIFAIGVTIVMFSTFFADIGLAYGLIQKETVDADDVRFVWTWQWLLGGAVMSALLLFAHPLAAWYGKPETTTVFRALSIVVLLNAITAPSTNLLKRALNYRRLQIGQVGGYLVGYVLVGIPCAWAGLGPYALALSWIVQSLVTLAIVYTGAKHSIRPLLWIAGGRKMLGYGTTVLSTNLINWVLTSADKIIVGRGFSAVSVGLYSNAYNLVNSPASAVYTNLQSVVFSSCARLQDDRDALRAVFLNMCGIATLVVFPAFAMIACGADIVVAAIYGARWAASTPFVAIFAWATPFLTIWGISTPLLWNSGHSKLEFKLQIPLVAIWLTCLYLASSQPLHTFACVAALLFVLRCLIMAYAVTRVLQIPLSGVWQVINGGLIMLALVAAIASLVDIALADLPWNAQLKLVLLGIATVTTYLAGLLLLGRQILDGKTLALLAKAAQRLPRWIAPAIQHQLQRSES